MQLPSMPCAGLVLSPTTDAELHADANLRCLLGFLRVMQLFVFWLLKEGSAGNSATPEILVLEKPCCVRFKTASSLQVGLLSTAVPVSIVEASASSSSREHCSSGGDEETAAQGGSNEGAGGVLALGSGTLGLRPSVFLIVQSLQFGFGIG